MNILVVNDDSIYAPGIQLLAQAAAQFGKVWVVAPANQCSAMSHKVSIGGKLRVEKITDFPAKVECAYKVDGTPADCVKVALQSLLTEKADYVFSGINNGYNVGYEIAYSGTMAAAMEGIMNGIPAIAFSNANNAPMAAAEIHIVSIIKELIDKQPLRNAVWNVNFPAVAPIKGILYDRTVAPVWLYNTDYKESEMGKGHMDLEIGGVPITTAETVPARTDMEAVLNGCISIGKVRCSVL